MTKLYFCICGAMITLLGSPLYGQLTVADTLSTQELIETLFGGGITVTNITTTCDTNVSLMQFDGSNSNLGLPSGVIISSGEALDAAGPNNSTSTTTNVGSPGDAQLSSIITSTVNTGFDACVIEFDIVPLCDTIGIRYVFASEEYPEFAPPQSSSFNDVFAFFISGPGIAGTQNIALIPGTTTPVSINNVNPVNFSQYYVDNNNQGTGTVEYDGFTTPLLASSVVQACETYHIKLAIQDVGDGAYDSSVFLEAGGIGCVSPVLTLNAVNSTALGTNVAVEGCVNFGVFTFQLDQDLMDTTVFRFTIGGTATPGLDYAPIVDSVIMPAGQTTIDVPVLVYADGIAEGQETIEIYYVDSSLCSNSIYYDTAVMNIWDQPTIPQLQDVALCSDDTIPIGFTPDPTMIYGWNNPTGLSDDSVSNPLLTLINNSLVEDTVSYTLTTLAFQGYCIWVDSMEAVVRPEIQGSFSVDTACFGYEHTFTPQILGDSLISWLWGFGDNDSSSLEIPTHIYAAPGDYQAALIVENVWGCRDTSYEGVYVDSLPVMNFTVAPVCLGTNSFFLNDARPSVSYVWDFGDGTSSTLANPTHTYLADGTYSVLLTATTEAGCVDSLRQDAIVYANPIASFSTSEECLNTPTVLTNLSTEGSGTQLSYQWNVGDSISTQVSFDHVFGDFGFHTVNLVVTDEYGCTDDTTAQALVYALPIADFVPDSLCAEDYWQIDNLSSVPDSSAIVSYAWRMGDGQTSMLEIPNIRYLSPGPYTVFLKVVTEHGCPDSTEADIEIYPPPISQFESFPACLYDSAATQSLSEVENVFEDRLVEWLWEWGDGFTTGSLTRAGHVYREPGLYDITLTVETDKGCTDASNRSVEIYPLPDAPELINDTVCFGDEALLLAIDGDHTQRLEWRHDPTDDDPFLVGNSYVTPPVLYTQTYYVQAISDKFCAISSLPVEAERYDDAELEIMKNADVLDIPMAILSLRVGTNVPLASYSWDLGDGTTSEVATPTHEYEHPGIYTILLHATDIHGCEYNLRDVIEIKQVIGVHVPTAFSPNGDGINDSFYLKHRLMRSLNFQVFNRWGELVFQADHGDFTWDGYSMTGKALGEGVYMFHVRGIDIHGNTLDQSGTITLLR